MNVPVAEATWADALVIVGVALMILCAAVCRAWIWIRGKEDNCNGRC